MSKKTFFNIKKLVFGLGMALVAVFFFINPAQAAITESGPPIDAMFDPSITAGGGTILPLAKFLLIQSSGTDTLTQVGVRIIASTTMTQGEIARISLWKESGARPDFQIDQDTFLAGAASTSPLTDGTLIVLQPTTAVSIGSTPTEFFILATTTAVSGITNGHAFNVSLQNNYASTSASTGVGTVFSSNKKITLNQSATVKISEVRAGSTSNAGDEFIELYNTGDADIDLRALPLSLHIFDTAGSSSPKTITYYKSIIPHEGFFLITSQTNYSGTVPPDATYSTLSGNTLAANTGFAIATSTSGLGATSTAIDFVGWGTQAAANCENADTTGTVCATALAENGSSLERIALGFPSATSTAGSMAQAGIDASKGNGVDRNDNSAEFVLQTTAFAQNSFSPPEFAHGGGGSDTSALQVMGSFPGSGMTNAPLDITFVGFGFNKMVATGTIISAAATTTVTLTPTAGGSNLCTSVTYNPFPGSFEPPAKCVLSSSLLANTSYTFTVTSNVRDLSGNALDQDGFQAGNQSYTATFTTGGSGQTSTNVTPPSVVGTSPFPGSLNVPTNLAKIAIEFNQTNIDTSTLNSTNITLTGAGSNVSLSGFSFSTTTSKNILSITPGALAANTQYTLTVGTGVKNTNSIFLPVSYVSKFTTGPQSDTTGPAIVGVLPTPGSTIAANTNDFIFTFDDNIDSTTATSGSVTLSTGGANLPGTVQYQPVSKEGHFAPQNVLPLGQTLTLTLVGASIKNVSGVAIGANITRTWTVEAANSDSTGPSILFANANDFSTAITFNEAVNSTDATNLSNYTVTAAGVAQTLSSLAGHQLTYDATNRTATLTGLRLAAGASITISAQNIKDISGNQMTAASSFTFTASSFSQSGGMVGPASFSGSTMVAPPNFSTSGIGFMPPVNIRPQSTFVSASTTYGFELPISKQIPADGTIVVTFPSSSDFGLCCAATTSAANPFIASQNADINGPGTGAIGIKTIARNATAKTVTVTLDTATRSESGSTHDFLKFSLTDLKNPSIPKGLDSSGYALDIKSKDAAGGLLESFTSNPVYITGGSSGGGATTTIQGNVSGNGGNLQGVTIHMVSPQTGPVDAATDGSGNYQFTNISVNSQFLTNNFGGGGDYMLFTDPFISPTGTTTNFFGNTMPTPVSATSSSIITRNFVLTATSSAINFAVQLTAAANTFTATEQLDVFAGGPGQFVVRTVTPGAGTLAAATLTTIPIPQTNGIWGIGIGPAMPKGGGGGFSGPPPSPNWAMPKPVEVTISGCPSACIAAIDRLATTSNTFTISAADKTIAGILRDGSNNAIANSMVFAYSPTGGTGNHAQTSASGVFSIRVTTGSYVVGSFNPGLGKSREVSVVVNSSGSVFVDGSPSASTGSSGANPFILKMVKPNFTITGQITDGTNPIGNAPVFAYRTDGPGRVDALSDSSTGNYTLYVDNGTWKVSSFIPGFGPMTEQTVTISGASRSNINFAPSSGSIFSILSGNIYEDANSNNAFNANEGITGAIIRLSGVAGFNEGVSGNDGAFSVRVPSGTGYTIIDVFHPSYGKIAPLKNDGTAIGTLNLTASTTQNIRVPVRNTITINIKDSSGALLTVPKAFIDLFDATTKQGNRVELTNASSTTLLVASGTAPTLRAFVQGVPPANVSVSSDNVNTTVSAAGVLTIDNAAETVKVTVNTTLAALSTVTGTVYNATTTSGNELADAWIQFVDQTNGVHFGTQATSSGIYLLKAANGTYQVMVSKPGFVGSPATVVVSGNATKNFVLNAASLTISGNVTAGGSVAANAFVRAEKIGGGRAITQTDTSGNYTLNVTSGSWRVFAVAEGYAEGGSSSNPVAVSSSVSSVNVALTTTVSLQSKLATSNTFTDTAAGSFSDSTVGVTVDLDSNALGASGNSSYFTARETSNIPNTSSVNIVGNKAKDISAFSGGSQVKNLQSGKKAAVELSYTAAELTAEGITSTTTVGKLTVVSYSEDKQEWESLSTVATYKDSSGNVVTPTANLSNVSSVSFSAVGTHFSAYALSQSVGVNPPDTPTGFGAAAGAAGSNRIVLTWTTSSGAEGYYIYRSTVNSGDFPLSNTLGDVITLADTSVQNGTTYYYKIAAYKSGGAIESAASASVNAIIAAGGTGGGGGGGVFYGSVGAVGTPVSAATSATPATTTAVAATPAAAAKPTPAAPLVAQPSAIAQTVSPVFNKDLVRGVRNNDVKRVQQLFAADKSIYPEGLATGFFGPATENAVRRFQLKYGVIKKAADPGNGKLGPKTRAKLKEIFGAAAVPAAPAAAAIPASQPAAQSDAEKIKALQEQLRLLQEQLKALQKK